MKFIFLMKRIKFGKRQLKNKTFAQVIYLQTITNFQSQHLIFGVPIFYFSKYHIFEQSTL